MIDDFLRPAHTRGEKLADAIRILAVLSVVVALVTRGPTGAGIVAFCLPGVMWPRSLALPSVADATVCVLILVAAWSNVVDLYRTLWWWDIPVHAAVTTAITVMAYLSLARWRIVPPPGASGAAAAGTLFLALAVGLALGAVWEMVEWFGYAVITDEIHVTYADTIGDLAADGLGALVAGRLLVTAPQLLIPTARPTIESSATTRSR